MADSNIPGSDVVFFDAPPVFYRTVDLAGLPGSPGSLIPYEVEPTLPYPVEEAVFVWEALGGRRFLVAAASRRDLEALLAGRAKKLRAVLHRPLAEALLRAPGGKEEAEIEAGGYRFRFQGKRLVAAELAAPGVSDRATPEAELREALAKKKLLGHAPLDFAPALGCAAALGGRPLLRWALAGLVLAAAFGIEGHGLARRAEAARAASAEAYGRVFPGRRLVAPRTRIASEVEARRARVEFLEAVLSKRTSALSILAAITETVDRTLEDTAAPKVRDLRIAPDRIEVAGLAETPEAAQALRDAVAALPGLGEVTGPEIRRAGRMYDFYIEAERLQTGHRESGR